MIEVTPSGYAYEEPNEPPEPKIAFLCYECGEPIREGDDYYFVDCQRYCEECIGEMRETAHID